MTDVLLVGAGLCMASKGDFWLRNYGYTERAPQPSQAITDAPPSAPGDPRP